jgi:hypothetical protein
MNTLAAKVNADPALAAVPIDSPVTLHDVGATPVLATPATLVTVAAGVGLVGAVAGLFGAGYAMGRAIGSPSKPPQRPH